jgi:uncharacterized membrane-anchored protein
MTPEMTKSIIELIAIALMAVLSILLLRYYTTRTKAGQPMGIGWRAIQTIVVVMTIPVILILSLEQLIDAALTGTLLGAVLGYALSPKDS